MPAADSTSGRASVGPDSSRLTLPVIPLDIASTRRKEVGTMKSGRSPRVSRSASRTAASSATSSACSIGVAPAELTTTRASRIPGSPRSTASTSSGATL